MVAIPQPRVTRVFMKPESGVRDTGGGRKITVAQVGTEKCAVHGWRTKQ